MKRNHHLISNEQNALQVSDFVQDYSGMRLDQSPAPSDVPVSVSDFITDLAHFASVNGAEVSDVLSKAFQNYLEEISGGDAPKNTVDRFRALIDEAIYEVTIGSVASQV